MISNTDTSLRPRLSVWLPFGILLCAALCVFSIAHRYGAESRNKAVGIAVDWETVEAFSASQGISTYEGVRVLKAAGVTSVVLAEETVAGLISRGQYDPTKPVQDFKPSAGVPGKIVDPGARVYRGVANRFGPRGVKQVSTPPDSGPPWATQHEISMDLIRGTSVGLNPEVAGTVRGAELQVIGRFSNPNGASSDYVRKTIAWAKQLGMSVFLPQGEQVLGRRDAMPALLESLKEHKILYASPEFTKLAGDANMVVDAPELVVRMHSAQTQELDKMNEAGALERYAKAARERNQRLLLVRPLSPTAEKPLDNLGAFVEKLDKELKKDGLERKLPHPFEDSRVPAWLFLLVGLSIAPIVFWTAGNFVSSNTWKLAGAALLLLLAAACYKEIGRPYMALLAAITFPIAAFIILDRKRPSNWPLEFLMVSGVSLVGGLCVAALLNGLPYFVRADQFPGVKAAVFLPIFLVGAYFLWKLMPLKDALDSPIKWVQAVLTIVGLGAAAFLFMRTGNDNPAAVSGLELKMRDVLDAVLFVRPRTKEFVFGHPALVLGIASLLLWRRGEVSVRPGWIVLLLTLGAVGQTSIVNTMCHLHTPVALSLARIGVGLLIGGIIGAILWIPVKSLLVRSR